MKRANSRTVRAGTVTIGGGAPIVVQSMAATRTQDIEATVNQVEMIHNAGGGPGTRGRRQPEGCGRRWRRCGARVPQANLVVDLQENYRLVTQVAPHVNKVRYNPGHLYHHEK